MMTITASTFGARLQTARMLAGIEQDDMARRLNVSRSTISKWERGITEPTVSMFMRWAAETNQPAEAILDGLDWCALRGSNPGPTDSESLGVELAFWAIVEPVEVGGLSAR